MIPDFNLPARTFVNKVVPKNAFEGIASSKQKKRLTEIVDRIIWQNKLSAETINLDGVAVKEIQVFHVPLRKREIISDLLSLIDKTIPYHILFVVSYEEEYYLSLAIKHPHPADQNLSVIDWTFTSDWLGKNSIAFGFALRKNLDAVLLDLSTQLTSTVKHFDTVYKLAHFEKQKSELEGKISKLQVAIEKAEQFKEKVRLNQELQMLVIELDFFLKN